MGKKIVTYMLVCAVTVSQFFSMPARAQTDGFALQVTPSPIVENLQPGVSKTVELKIRNQSTQKETLKMGLRSFKVDAATSAVELQDTEPQDVKSWVRFAEPTFDVEAGAWYTQKITFDTPSDAGFSYSFAVYISRAKPAVGQAGAAAIEGSVAVFTLLGIDRPDAVRKLETVTFTSKKKVYEYLPATFTLDLKNSGNTIVRPTGNIYIQRSLNSTEPIAVLPVNESGAYILPATSRSTQSQWTVGFPSYEKKAESEKQQLVWDWGKAQNFRFGKYTAKAIVVYNDGQRDIPIEAAIEFWVIPWKLLFVVLIIAALLVVGIVTILKKTVLLSKKSNKKKHDDQPKKTED
jgi:hypothetical protein